MDVNPYESPREVREPPATKNQADVLGSIGAFAAGITVGLVLYGLRFIFGGGP